MRDPIEEANKFETKTNLIKMWEALSPGRLYYIETIYGDKYAGCYFNERDNQLVALDYSSIKFKPNSNMPSILKFDIYAIEKIECMPVDIGPAEYTWLKARDEARIHSKIDYTTNIQADSEKIDLDPHKR